MTLPPFYTALVVSGGGFQGLTLVQALRQRGATRVVVCDIFAEGVTRYTADHYETIPAASHPCFSEALGALVEREKVDVIFPATAHELCTLASLAESFEQRGVLVAVSPRAVIERLLDKQFTMAWLAACGIAVQRLVNFDDAIQRLPLVGKPRLGWGGQGLRILRHADDVLAQQRCADHAQYVWVPYIADFTEYSGDVALGAQGHHSRLGLRQRLRTSGGFSIISQTVADGTIATLMQQVIDALLRDGAHGLFNIQVILPHDGCPFVSDINPRIGTSASHALHEGINLPAAYLDMRQADRTTTTELRPPISLPANESPNRGAVKSVRMLRDCVIPAVTTPKGVVFDLDDTLIDHKLWMLDRLTLAVASLTDESLNSRISSSRMALLLARIVDDGERQNLVDRVAEATGIDQPLLLNAYRVAQPAHIEVYPDVLDTLRALRARGVATAILTDNPVPTQQSKIDALPAAIRDLIDGIVFSRQSGGEKPEACAFHAAATALGLQASDCVMVGDNYFRDAVGAIFSGYAHAFVIAREGSFIRPHRHFSSLVPDAIDSRIHRMDDLILLREALL